MSNVTELVFVIDRSGSMSDQATDVIGGFNAMLERQKEDPYPCMVTTVLFSNRIDVVCDRLPLEEVCPMTRTQYCVGGSTALMDAIGSTSRHIQNIHRYARLEDRSATTIFVIMTDGQENSSQCYNNGQVKRMVREQEEDAGWEFIFIGADMDAFAAANDVGIRSQRTVQISKDNDDFVEVFHALGRVASCAKESPEALRDDDFDDIMKIFKQR